MVRAVTAGGLADYVEHFRQRVLQDALTEGTAAYWEHRAEEWEAVRPRRGDFNGNATPRQLAEQYQRCTEIAAACRARAAFTRLYPETFGVGESGDALDNVLDEEWA